MDAGTENTSKKPWAFKPYVFSRSHSRSFVGQKLTQVLLAGMSDAVIRIDRFGMIIDTNERAAQLSGWSRQDLREVKLSSVIQLIDQVDRSPIDLLAIVQSCAILEAPPRQFFLISRNQTEYVVECQLFPLTYHGDQTLEIVLMLRDMTQLRNLGLQVSWQSHHDEITGLINRVSFEESLVIALEDTQQTGSPHILCQVDIDRFKLINDTFGSFAGDQLLRQMACLLLEYLRPQDILARIGADEFGILFWDSDLEQALNLAHGIQRSIEQFRFVWQGRSFSCSAAMGFVPIGHSSQDIAVLLSQADTACYAAKGQGPQSIQVFEHGNVEIEDLRHDQRWRLLISEALEDNRFQLYRQPIVARQRLDHPPDHYEVLVRMVSPSGGLITPADFISTAEKYDLMPVLDQWILDRCISMLELKTQPQNSDSIRYSINLSGTSLSNDAFLAYALERVTHMNCPHHCLGFEITETAAIANISKVKSFMESLQVLGCYFSLDDFGSGLSSYGYLRSLPVDCLKIDGHFVKDIATDPLNFTIVESITRISQKMGLTTIAEHVENAEALSCLETIGVDFFQGFEIGIPKLWVESDLAGLRC